MQLKPDLAKGVSDKVAWKSLKQMLQRFDFSEQEGRILMGDMPRSTFYKGVNQFEGTLSRDQKERISLLLGMYKSLRILFIDSGQALTWINRENALAPFYGQTPRAYLLDGSMMRLWEVRAFLDFWRGH